jgi:hypothetical protein
MHYHPELTLKRHSPVGGCGRATHEAGQVRRDRGHLQGSPVTVRSSPSAWLGWPGDPLVEKDVSEGALRGLDPGQPSLQGQTSTHLTWENLNVSLLLGWLSQRISWYLILELKLSQGLKYNDEAGFTCVKSNESEFEGCWGAKNPTPDCTTESRAAPQPYPWPKLYNRLFDSSSVAKWFVVLELFLRDQHRWTQLSSLYSRHFMTFLCILPVAYCCRWRNKSKMLKSDCCCIYSIKMLT